MGQAGGSARGATEGGVRGPGAAGERGKEPLCWVSLGKATGKGSPGARPWNAAAGAAGGERERWVRELCAAGRCAGNGSAGGRSAPDARTGGCSAQREKAEGTAGFCVQRQKS